MEYFLRPSTLLLIELLQPPTAKQLAQHPAAFMPASSAASGGVKAEAVHRVAWAFLRPFRQPRSAPPSSPGSASPAGPGGAPLRLGRLRLQLYSYPASGSGAASGSPGCCAQPAPSLGQGGPQEGGLPGAGVPAVFRAWQQQELGFGPAGQLPTSAYGASAAAAEGRRRRYPSSLHVTVAVLPRPQEAAFTADPRRGVRAVLPGQHEVGRLPLAQLLGDATSLLSSTAMGGDSTAAGEAGPYARAAGQPCQVPNALLGRIEAGPRGAVLLAFSHSGRYLAAACADRLMFPVRVFSTQSVASGSFPCVASFQVGRSSLCNKKSRRRRLIRTVSARVDSIRMYK